MLPFRAYRLLLLNLYPYYANSGVDSNSQIIELETLQHDVVFRFYIHTRAPSWTVCALVNSMIKSHHGVDRVNSVGTRNLS